MLKNSAFQDRVRENLEIAKTLQKHPWRLEELDRDPEVISALIAAFPDYIGGGTIGGIQPSATRESLRGLLDSEFAKSSTNNSIRIFRGTCLLSVTAIVVAVLQLIVAICQS